MQLILISGLSGSGKSIALQTLEDEGFYCIDNLPLSFLNAFFEKFNNHSEITKIAIGVDARGFPNDLLNAHAFISILKTNFPELMFLFLQASDEVILKRYHETRRKHPLSNNDRSLSEAIEYERSLLENCLDNANIIIDTSNLNVHQLRQQVKEKFLSQTHNLSIQLESFGFKNGIPLNSDFVFDARSLSNPHWEESIRKFTGRDECVKNFLDQANDVQLYLNTLKKTLDQWFPLFEAGTRSYLTFSIGCTGGKHRSVYLVERLKEHFSSQGKHIIVRHRELDKLEDCSQSTNTK